MADLYGLSADQVARLRRLLIAGNVPDRESYSRRSRRPPAWEPRIVVASTTISAGGSGLFDLRASTAAGSSETSYGSGLTAYDWANTGASSGDKAIAWKPYGARWYFLKPGGAGASANWGKVSVESSTRVTSGFGSTITDWVGVNPAGDAGGGGLDINTTVVVELPDVAFDSAPYLTTGDVIAYMPVGSAHVPVTQYAAPHAYFSYPVSNKTHGFSVAKNTLMFTTVNGTTKTNAANGLLTNFSIEENGTTSVWLVPKRAGAYSLSYTLHYELLDATSRTDFVRSYFGDSTGSVPDAIDHTQSVYSDFLYPTTADGQHSIVTHSQCCITELSTNQKLSVVLQTPSYAGVVRFYVSFTGHLVQAAANSHF